GIVRLRDIVRENRYYMRIRFDAAKLAALSLAPRDVIDAMMTRPRSIKPDPDAGATGGYYAGQPLTWIAYYGGAAEPATSDVAQPRLDLDGVTSAPGKPLVLDNLLVPNEGVVHLAAQDEQGVQLGSQQYDQSCTLDGQPSVALSIYQLPGSNALDTAQGVYKKMEELKKSFPEGMDYEIVYDTTPFIRESVSDLVKTLLEAAALLAIVVLVFVQNWRAGLYPL